MTLSRGLRTRTRQSCLIKTISKAGRSANEGEADTSCESLLGHDAVEVVHRHGAVTVRIGTFDHFLELLIGHGLSELAGNTSEVADGNTT